MTQPASLETSKSMTELSAMYLDESKSTGLTQTVYDEETAPYHLG